MAKKAHVPKFGNWDGDNVPYSIYFENAGKGKGTTGKAFNPRGLQENSEAFLSGIFPSEPEVRKSRENSSTGYRTVNPSEYEGRKSRDSSSKGRKSRDGSSNNFRIVNNSEPEGRKSRHSSSKDNRIVNNSEYEGRKSRDSSSPNNYRIVNNSEYEGRKSRDSSSNDYRTVNNSEYIGRKSRESSSNNYRTVKNNSEYEGRKSIDSSSNDYRTARRQQNKYGSKDDTEFGQRYMDTPPRGKNQRSGNSGYRSNRSPESTPERYRASSKQPEESSFGMLAPSPCRSGLKPGRLDDAMNEAPSSVPRFGSWDDTNPDSGDGFTVIFNKVKQEKKTAAAKVPRVPPAAPKVHPSLRSNRAKSSSKPKTFCCMSTPTRD